MTELEKALVVIQYECLTRKGLEECKKCPLGNGNGICNVANTVPEAWDLNIEDIVSDRKLFK